MSIFSIYDAFDGVVNKEVEAYNLLERTHYFNKYFRFRDRIVCSITNRIFGEKMDQSYLNKQTKLIKPIAELVKNEGHDMIHASFGNNPATIAMILSDLTQIPLTFESHAYDLFVDFPFADQKIKKASKIFTISDYNKQYLMNECSCPENKIIIKRVPFNKEFCSNLAAIKKRENLIVSVCRLHSTKGIEYALEALFLLRRKGFDVKYLLVGDGPLRSELKKRVDGLGLANAVRFVGNIKNTEALKYLRQATISILPSVIAKDGDRDGIPTSLIEAMYLGTACVSTTVSGIPELIHDGISGFLVEPKNILELAEKMEILILDNDLRMNMEEKAKEKVNSMFDIDENMDVLIRGWQDVVKQI